MLYFSRDVTWLGSKGPSEALSAELTGTLLTQSCVHTASYEVCERLLTIRDTSPESQLSSTGSHLIFLPGTAVPSPDPQAENPGPEPALWPCCEQPGPAAPVTPRPLGPMYHPALCDHVTPHLYLRMLYKIPK